MAQLNTTFFRALLLLTLLFVLQGCGSDDNQGDTISSPTNKLLFSADSHSIINNHQTIDVQYHADNLFLAYSPDAQPVSLLSFEVKTLNADTATIIVSVVEASRYPPGLHETTLRLSAGNAQNLSFAHHDIKVVFKVWDKTPLSFTGKVGDSNIDSETIDVLFNSRWRLSTNVDWLDFDKVTDKVNAQVTVTPVVNALATAGVKKGQINIRERDSGHVIKIPVELALDPLRFSSSKHAIAFHQVGNQQHLSESVNIYTSNQKHVPWQAHSNAAWLALETDLDNNLLSLSANTQLLEEGLYQSQVTISSVVDGQAVNQQFPVSFYKAATLNVDFIAPEFTHSAVNGSAFVLDPLRPYLYVARDDSFYAYHLFTGEKVHQQVIEDGAELSHFVVSPDGSYLFTLATKEILTASGEQATTQHYYRINLHDHSVTSLSSEQVTTQYPPKAIIFIDSQPMVITQGFELADMNLTVKQWPVDEAFLLNTLVKHPQKNQVFIIDNSHQTVKSFEVNYSQYADEMFKSTEIASYRHESFAQPSYQLAINSPGTRLYVANRQNEVLSFINNAFNDKGVLTEQDNSTAINVSTNHLGYSYFIRADENSGYMISIYDPADNLLSEKPIPPPQKAVISTNFHKVIVYYQAQNGSYQLYFGQLDSTTF